ncbi:DUF456 domain-containing protein [Arthrobacter sp. Br18]|uniref:DUF456 domain-containing protein n=1 Tax=Arthrobacter sp. Br18 TaxID=1312954 RepID=UPI00047C92BA|nr:DUF456 domain-containing protein [Arthrobacter sp. Br18]
MEFEILMTILTAVLIAVGIAGVVVPILPGSILIIGALLLWAFSVGGATGWVVFGLGSALAVAGLVAGLVLTGRTLQRRRIPARSITIGLVLAVIGMFVIPVVGLFVGFAAGLFGSEYHRQRSFRPALASSGHALKAAGLGILAELGLALAAGSIWIVGVWIHFLAR